MRLALVSGSSNSALASRVACEIGIDLEECAVERFPDGEIGVSMGPVRGADVYLVQTSGIPIHDNLVELLMLADAARRAGAARVTGVIPYLAYARQDRREAEGASLGARVIADALSASLDRVITVDLHASAVEGFFSCPVEHLSAIPLLAERVRPLLRDHIVVAPDLGAVKRAQRYASLLGLGMAGVRKRRLSGRQVEALGVDGDVRGHDVLIVDDMISTGATIVVAANALRAAGAGGAIAVATHGLLVAGAAERLDALALDAVMISDSVVAPTASRPRITVVGLAALLGDVITRVHRDAPLAELVGDR